MKLLKEKIISPASLHIERNIKIYIILLSCFMVGIISGTLAVLSLRPDSKAELSDYLDGFLQLYNSQQISPSDVFLATFSGNLKTVAVVWITGASVIGSPFICITTMIRGFIVSFTAALLIWVAGTGGVLFLFIGILPNELVFTMLLLILSAKGIVFSVNILKPEKGNKNERFVYKLLKFSGTAGLILIGMMLSSLLSAWIIPAALRII